MNRLLYTHHTEHLFFLFKGGKIKYHPSFWMSFLTVFEVINKKRCTYLWGCDIFSICLSCLTKIVNTRPIKAKFLQLNNGSKKRPEFCENFWVFFVFFISLFTFWIWSFRKISPCNHATSGTKNPSKSKNNHFLNIK